VRADQNGNRAQAKMTEYAALAVALQRKPRPMLVAERTFAFDTAILFIQVPFT